MKGAIGFKLPDVRAAIKTDVQLKNTWTSLSLHDLEDGLAESSRPLFDLKERETDRDAEIDGSLNHRTISARIRFYPFVHAYTEKAKGKRKADGEPVVMEIRRSAKEMKRIFNLNGGAARFIYNKALEFIRRQPVELQITFYNTNRLQQILLTTREYTQREIRAQKPDESNEKYQKFLAGKQAALDKNAAAREEFADENLIRNHPWLEQVDSRVRQQAIKCLVDAFKANLEKAKKARASGKGGSRFKMGFKKRSKPSAWTFSIPKQTITAEHVDRPSNGKAVQGQPQPQNKPHTWTKLTLPATMGGNDVGPGSPAYCGGMVYLTQKVDIHGGKLLADVDFTRDRLGHWNTHCQRAPLKAPKPKPMDQRKTAFFDPGSRTGNTVYMPDSGQVAELMAGDGGATRLFTICLKTDKLITEQKTLDPHSQAFKNLKRREHYQRIKAYNLVRDGHIRMAAFIWSKVDTAVVPLFDTHRVARKPLSPDDPRRKINCKTVRQLFSLRHAGFRDRLRHSADTMGKEYVNASEEYTTIGCPCCLKVNAKFSGPKFTCRFCQYEAPRDIKSGLTLAIKCLAAP